MLDWGETGIFGKAVLVVGQEPKLIKIWDEFEGLGDDDLVAEMGRVEGAAEEGDVHGLIIPRVGSSH